MLIVYKNFIRSRRAILMQGTETMQTSRNRSLQISIWRFKTYEIEFKVEPFVGKWLLFSDE